MQQKELIPHLFRMEFSKIAVVICRRFGIEHIEVAEDIAGETFLSALEIWPYKGIPEEPVAWLYTVAKNKAKNYLARNKLFAEKISYALKQQAFEEFESEIDLSEKNIKDSQLQMLFAVCHPSISKEAQVGLSLRILCGFGIEEIANAFLTSKETISKRLFRAKEKLRDGKIRMEVPVNGEIINRLDAVLATLYLLFNEGYYSESRDDVLREDLCFEAMRLTSLLIEHQETNTPAVKALLSLMCFHASRFKARRNESGELILYHDQDESLWNQELITRGAYLLHQAAHGKQFSKYHLEAGIAYWHTIKSDSSEKWDNILQLYNRLLQLQYSPIAALNRIYALSKVYGTAHAIEEAGKLKLESNHFYFMLLGELHVDIDNTKAKQHFEKAITLAKTLTEKQAIEKKISSLNS